MGFTLTTLEPTIDIPVVCLMYSNDGTVKWNTEGVRRSLLGCAAIRLHCCWKVSSADRRTMAN